MTMTDEFQEKKGPSKTWMVIFADLTALLLTFFVLLFSMSSVKIAEWEEIVSALSTKLGVNVESTEGERIAPLSIEQSFAPKSVDLSYLRTILESKLKDDPVLAQTKLRQLNDRMIISLSSEDMFEPASAVLTEQARMAVAVLGDALLVVGNRIDVAGHTDPSPISTWEYPSNWALSLARAVSVAGALKEAGYTADVAALGYGDSRYGELSSDLSEAQKLMLSRRVDVIIRESSGDAYEP